MTPFTDGYGRTRLRSHCTLWCRLARTVALAAGPRPGSFEPLPADDAAQYHRHVPFGGNAA